MYFSRIITKIGHPSIFYPPSKQVLSCNDGYCFDTFYPSRPLLDETFDDTFISNIKIDEYRLHLAPTHGFNEKNTSNRTPHIIHFKTINPPVNLNEDSYVVQNIEDGAIFDILHNKLYGNNPNVDPATINLTQPLS